MAQDTKQDSKQDSKADGKSGGPMDRLKAEAGGLVGAFTDRAISAARDKVTDATGRLTEYVEGGAGPGLMAAVTGARNLAEGKSPARSFLGAGMAGLKEKVSGMFGRGKGKRGGKQKIKLTNIVETIDVGVPLRLAYDQWTEYPQFPTFMKKVDSAQRDGDGEKINWKAQVFWSHRTWEASILEQRPDERIIWRSKGQKGHVDGTVTFHELTPNLTRIVVVLEYHPQGMFERTGNIWRAQGRRVRLEMKHFQRHVMTNTILHPDDIEGWRGVIEDGKVVKDHETAVKEEDQEQEREQERGNGEDTAEATGSRRRRPAAETDGTEPDETAGDLTPADEAPDGEAPDGEAPEDEAPDDEAPEDETPEDEASDEARADAESDGMRARRAAPRRQSRGGRASDRSRTATRSTARGGER